MQTRLKKFRKRLKRYVRNSAHWLAGLRLPSQVENLFDGVGVYTKASGYSHAKFNQSTELASSLNYQILETLTETGVDFIVFAGSLIGLVRDGRTHLWNDDLDVMIFKNAFDNFTNQAIPLLESRGFRVYPTTHWKPTQPFGGYAILGAAKADHSHYELRLDDSTSVKVPRAQVDVFFSRIDPQNRVRNVGVWGRYHKKAPPLNVILPSRHELFDGRSFATYRNPVEGVRYEYGNVQNFIDIYSHHKEFRRLTFVSPNWIYFRSRFEAALKRTTLPTLPGGPSHQTPVNVPGQHYRAADDEPLSSMLANLSTHKYSSIVLSGANVLWAMDLVFWFPGLKVIFEPADLEESLLGTQLSGLLESMDDRPS